MAADAVRQEYQIDPVQLRCNAVHSPAIRLLVARRAQRSTECSTFTGEAEQSAAHLMREVSERAQFGRVTRGGLGGPRE
jgi:hypothetical protein